jgi:hypothetical protein
MEFVVDKMKEYVHRVFQYYHIDPKELARSLLALDIFSDLTITCGEKQWKVHKNLLWIQSDYFRKLLNENFKVKKRSHPRHHPKGERDSSTCFKKDKNTINQSSEE